MAPKDSHAGFAARPDAAKQIKLQALKLHQGDKVFYSFGHAGGLRWVHFGCC